MRLQARPGQGVSSCRQMEGVWPASPSRRRGDAAEQWVQLGRAPAPWRHEDERRGLQPFKSPRACVCKEKRHSPGPAQVCRTFLGLALSASLEPEAHGQPRTYVHRHTRTCLTCEHHMFVHVHSLCSTHVLYMCGMCSGMWRVPCTCVCHVCMCSRPQNMHPHACAHYTYPWALSPSCPLGCVWPTHELHLHLQIGLLTHTRETHLEKVSVAKHTTTCDAAPSMALCVLVAMATQHSVVALHWGPHQPPISWASVGLGSKRAGYDSTWLQTHSALEQRPGLATLLGPHPPASGNPQL